MSFSIFLFFCVVSGYTAPEYCTLPPARMRTIEIIGIASDKILAEVKLVNVSFWEIFIRKMLKRLK